MPASEAPPSAPAFTQVHENALALDLVRAVNKAIERVLDERPDVNSDLRNRVETAAKAVCIPLVRQAATSCREATTQVIGKLTS